jgi:hypothetical protein
MMTPHVEAFHCPEGFVDGVGVYLRLQAVDGVVSHFERLFKAVEGDHGDDGGEDLGAHDLHLPGDAGEGGGMETVAGHRTAAGNRGPHASEPKPACHKDVLERCGITLSS